MAEVTRVRNFIVFDGRTAAGTAIRDPDYVQAGTPLDPAGWAWTTRTKLVSGRLADPARADEAVIDFPMAERFGLGVGDRFALRFVRPGEEEIHFSGRKVPSSTGRTIGLRVVGISAASGTFPPRPQAAGGGFAELTPAFAGRYAATLGGSESLTVWLRHGTAELEGSRGRSSGWPAGRRSTPSPPPGPTRGASGAGGGPSAPSACWSSPCGCSPLSAP